MTTPVGTFNQIHRENVGLKFIRWIVFSVILSLTPIVVAFLFSWTTNYPLTLTEALSRGQLLLISIAISGAALGELIGDETMRSKGLKLVLTGLNFLVVIFSSMWYAGITSALAGHQPVNANAVFGGSLFVFLSSVLLGIVYISIPSLEVP